MAARNKGFGPGFYVVLAVAVGILIMVANQSFGSRLQQLWNWFGSIGEAQS